MQGSLRIIENQRRLVVAFFLRQNAERPLRYGPYTIESDTEVR